MSQIILNALVAHYIDMDRNNELYSVEAKVKKGRCLKERALIMIAFAKARVAHPAFNKRFGLKEIRDKRTCEVSIYACCLMR